MSRLQVRSLVAFTTVVLLGIAAIVSAQGLPLSATLTGAAEVPPGDPNGTGTANIVVNQGQGEICWTIQVTDITLPASAAHIHIAPTGIAGPVVVPLSAPGADGFASGCRPEVRPDVIKGLLVAPELFYVNVHNADFPAGAVRGQLSK